MILYVVYFGFALTGALWWGYRGIALTITLLVDVVWALGPASKEFRREWRRLREDCRCGPSSPSAP